jgi:hypothetical protein
MIRPVRRIQEQAKHRREQLAADLCTLFDPEIAELEKTYGPAIGENVKLLAEQSVIAYGKRLRRFRIASLLLGLVVVAAAGAVSGHERFPLKYSIPTVVILYMVGVLLPVFDLRPRLSGRYRDRLDAAFDDFKPVGILFDCLDIESMRRLAFGAMCFVGGLVAILVSELTNESDGAAPFRSLSLALFYVGAVVILPIILVRLAYVEMVPKAALSFPPERDAFIAVCDVLCAADRLAASNEVQRFTIVRLESVAVSFETKIPRTIGLDSRRLADQQAFQRFGVVAAGVRSLKASVALPERNTGNEVRAEIASTGAALASRCYGYLFERHSARTTTPSPVSRALASLSFARTTLLALAPGIALGIAVLGFHQPNDPHLQASLTVFSISWALANLAAASPRGKDVVTLAKDIDSTASPS